MGKLLGIFIRSEDTTNKNILITFDEPHSRKYLTNSFLFSRFTSYANANCDLIHILRLISANQFLYNHTSVLDHIQRGCFYPGHNKYPTTMSIKETNLISAFTSFGQTIPSLNYRIRCVTQRVTLEKEKYDYCPPLGNKKQQKILLESQTSCSLYMPLRLSTLIVPDEQFLSMQRIG